MVRAVSNNSMRKTDNEMDKIYYHILELYEKVKKLNQVNCVDNFL